MRLASAKVWCCVKLEGKSCFLFGVHRTWSSDASPISTLGRIRSAVIVLASNSLLIVAYGGADTAVSRLAIAFIWGACGIACGLWLHSNGFTT